MNGYHQAILSPLEIIIENIDENNNVNDYEKFMKK